jgi:hypothetical protein
MKGNTMANKYPDFHFMSESNPFKQIGNALNDIDTRLDGATGGEAVADATTAKSGLVKQGAAVADAAGEAPTAAEYNALLASLRAAGVLAK